MAHRQYFTEEISGLGDAGNDVLIFDGIIPDGLEYHYKSISVENETTTASNVILGYKKSGIIHKVAGVLALIPGYPSSWDNLDLVLPSLSQLVVVVENSSNNDILKVVITGFIWDTSKVKRQ